MTVTAQPPALYHYRDLSHELRATAIALIVIPTLAVLARLWCRRLTRRFWWDDFFVVLCLIASNAVQAVCIWGTFVGLGKESAAIKGKANAMALSLPTIVERHLFVTALTLLKLAVLSTYAFCFRVKRAFKWTLWVTAGVVVAWFVVMVLTGWLMCHPASKAIGPFKPGNCQGNSYAWNIAQSTINFVLDLVILILPVPIIWKLQFSIRRRTQIVGIFLIGYCSAAISLARFIFILKSTSSTAVIGNPYMPARIITLLFLGLTEIPLGLLALCIVPIANGVKANRPHAKKIWAKLTSVKTRPSEHQHLSDTRMTEDSKSKLHRAVDVHIREVFLDSNMSKDECESHPCLDTTGTTSSHTESRIRQGRYLSV